MKLDKDPVVIYSCSYSEYDFTFGPLKRTPHAKFLRFGKSRWISIGWWKHLDLPPSVDTSNQTLSNRMLKLFPHKFLPASDVAIYVDGNILIRRDLTPLINEFVDSGADMALFPHPSGRTLNEEIDFALQHRIPNSDFEVTEQQRSKYEQIGILGETITENSIIFFNLKSPRIRDISEIWWQEIMLFCKRDQISLPFAVWKVKPLIHFWDWHFAIPSEKNVYFARYRHKPKGIFDQVKYVIFFLKDFYLLFRIMHNFTRIFRVLRDRLPKRVG